ncbi:BRAP2 RING ZnF UBP domain-containing protein 2 [Oryza brachyantha]|uniref:BRCA1-associated protein n=1 Tax=Oryza brachyantha TaxID=4533 RepID=J3LA95_ORYBR|nr:BRAP2 RING ZnF UBP domain-containing protein 2 [Oryza brachyantha]
MAIAGETKSLAPSASSASSNVALDSVPFSSGNPLIEEARGVVVLHPDPPAAASSSSVLPVGRKPRVCVPAVPNHLTYADFCHFCAFFLEHMLEMRIVRIDGVEDQYSVLIKFDSQSSTDDFYKHFNGKPFTSLEGNVCHVRFVEDVHYTQLIEHAHSSATSSAEQPTCPVCLERLDQDPGGILTTICNHSFHCSCMSKWTDSSCPVCRYCQQQPEKSTCSICGTLENLWICVICGHVGCGRYKGGHAIEHWKETQHCYSLELETQKVWDYAGDNYVHRLIQSKTDGNLVEYNLYGDHSANGMCSTCSGDAGIGEALLNSKVEDIVEEYNDLVTSQLEKQRNYYESLLLEVKEDTQKQIVAATEKAMGTKVQKLQAKLDKCMEETKFLNDIHESLVENMEMWRERIQKAKEREQAAIRLKDKKIAKLEEELRGLIAHFECQNTVTEASNSISSDMKLEDNSSHTI